MMYKTSWPLYIGINQKFTNWAWRKYTTIISFTIHRVKSRNHLDNVILRIKIFTCVLLPMSSIKVSSNQHVSKYILLHGYTNQLTCAFNFRILSFQKETNTPYTLFFYFY